MHFPVCCAVPLANLVIKMNSKSKAGIGVPMFNVSSSPALFKFCTYKTTHNSVYNQLLAVPVRTHRDTTKLKNASRFYQCLFI